MADGVSGQPLSYKTGGEGSTLNLNADFWHRYWERQPLFLEQIDNAAFGDVFSLDKFEELLAFGAMRKGFVTLVDHGVNVPPTAFCKALDVGGFAHDDIVDPVVVENFRSAGATTILAAVHLYCRTVGYAAEMLACSTGREIEAHAFHTPAGTGGLAPHFDGEDNFLLQLEGTKYWTVTPPSPGQLPVVGGRPVNGYQSDPARVVKYTLRPGDLLYIPRGWLHSSVTERAASLHITFQVLPSLLCTAISERMEGELEKLGLTIATLPGPGCRASTEVIGAIRHLASSLDEWADHLEEK